MNNYKPLKFLLPFIPLPATIIGVYTMYYFNTPKQLWLLNLACVCLGTLIAILFSRRIKLPNNNNPYPILITATVLLLCTFNGTGIENVHRWLNFKSFQLNIGLMVSPLILIQISKISKLIPCIFFAILTNIIFLLQPDASLVTAFSLASFILILHKTKNKNILILLFLCSLFLIIFSWYNLDSLEPVNYVEGIIAMTKQISPFLFFASIISLLFLILPFMSLHSEKDNLSIALGIYFSLLLLVTFVGNFPVMMMGYGFAPIIGYYIGLIWKINTLQNKT